jgi:hypothetical protein
MCIGIAIKLLSNLIDQRSSAIRLQAIDAIAQLWSTYPTIVYSQIIEPRRQLLLTIVDDDDVEWSLARMRLIRHMCAEGLVVCLNEFICV